MEDQNNETLTQIAARLCNGRDCAGCPMDKHHKCKEPYLYANDCIAPYLRNNVADAEEQIKTMLKWAVENPPKPARTYLDDFLEKFPDAPRGRGKYEKYPVVDIYSIYPLRQEKEHECFESDGMAEWNKPFGYWNT